MPEALNRACAYVVMELVRGIPILAHLTQQAPPSLLPFVMNGHDLEEQQSKTELAALR